MKVFKTVVSLSDSLSPVPVDTIDCGDSFCLVLKWGTELNSDKSRTPEKVLRLEKSLFHHETGHANGDYALTKSIPRAVLEGLQSENGYTVEDWRTDSNEHQKL